MGIKRCLYPGILCVCLALWSGAFFGYLGWKPGFAYNAQRYFEVFLLGNLLLVGATIPIRFRWGRLWGSLSSLLLLIMLVVIWESNNTWLAMREGLQYLALFAGIVVVAKARRLAGPEAFDRAAYTGIVLFCFGCSLIVLEGLLLSLSINVVDERLVFGAFVNVRIFAELQFLTILLLPAAWLKAPSGRWRYFVGITSVLWWGLLFLTGTRSALVVLPFSFFVLWLVVGRETIGWFRVLFSQIAGGVMVFLALRGAIAWYLGGSFWGQGGMSFARAGSSGRLDIWLSAWRLYLEHPWLGNGPGAFACKSDWLVSTPHNLFFQLLSEWGGLMAVLCLVLALLMFYALVKYLRRQVKVDPLNYSLFSTLVVVVSASMMEGMIIGPLQQMLIVLVFGWSLHIFAGDRFQAVSANELMRHCFSRLAILGVISVCILWGVKADLSMQRDLLVSPEGVIKLTYGPRFWADGHDHCTGWHESNSHL